MALFAGKNGYVEINGDKYPFAEWSLSIRCDKVNSTDISRRTQKVDLGPPLAEITCAGFYEKGLGAIPGDSVDVTLGIGADDKIGPFSCKFEGTTINHKIKDAGRIDMRFVVDEDFIDGVEVLEL